MIKKQIIWAVTAAVLAFSGCGDDRSHPAGGIDEDGNPIVHRNPLAVMDVSAPLRSNGDKGFTASDDDDNNTDTLLFRWFSANDTLVFDGSNSKDLDTDGNTSIQEYIWNVKNEDNTTMSDACIDQNRTGSKLIVKICDEADDPEYEKFSVTLTVKDNEDKTSSTKKIITLY